MDARPPVILAVLLFLALPLAAQKPRPSRVPVETPQGWPQNQATAGLPWPTGLGKREALTGHIGAMDRDQIMVRSLDYGEVLFWVDNRTVVRVDKYPLSLGDLRVGDPVAVRLKNIKGRGPYATEILPHPDVRSRKERGEPAKPADSPAAAHGGLIPAEAAPGAAPAATAKAPAPEPVAPAEPFPSLPPGSTGLVGTVAGVTADSVELRDTNNRTQKVILTGVTLIKVAGSETVLPAVKAGDRVAIVGDPLDSGEWIAREVLVSQAAAAAGAAGAAPAAAATLRDQLSPDGLLRLSGPIVSLGNEEIRVKTPSGERTVLVTGITDVRRMGVRGSFASLRQGDEVRVVGDLLEGGVVSAREVQVTKLAGS